MRAWSVTPAFAMRSLPNAVWFLLMVTPVDVRAEGLRRVHRERAPAAADVEHLVARAAA